MDCSALAEKHLRFYDVNTDERTLIHVYCTPGLPPRPLPRPDNEDERVAWSLRRCEAMIERRTWLPDDQVPFLSAYTGTELFAEAFGCPVRLSDVNMPFARPLVFTAAEAARLRRPSLDAPSLERPFRIARRLRQACPEGLVGLPDIQSPFDIAALIWAKEYFYAATIDEPEAVEDLCAMVEELLTAFLDRWFDEFGTDYVAHYPDLFMRGGMTLSEDEAGAISPGMFREYCLPALNRLSDRYGGIFVHCCANSEPQWDNFSRIRSLRLLNLNQPADVLDRGYRRFEGVCAQMHMLNHGDQNPAYYRGAEIPPKAHVILFAYAETRDEALRVYDELRAIRG